MIPLTLPEWLVALTLRTAVKPFLGEPFSVRVQRFSLAWVSELSMPPNGVTWRSHSLGGVRGRLMTPKPGPAVRTDAPAILHLHGGAFVSGSPRTHRSMAGHLAAYTGGPVYLPDYALAPEHPYPAGRDDALAAYRGLLAEGVDPARICLSGDSAGGLMALDLALDIRDAGLPMPAGLVLVSPSMGTPVSEDPDLGLADAFVRPGWIATAMAAYARPLDAGPSRGLGRDFGGLPPVLVQYGTREYLAGDSIALVAELRAAHVPVLVHPQNGAIHVLVTIGGLLPRAREAAQQIADFALANTGAAAGTRRAA